MQAVAASMDSKQGSRQEESQSKWIYIPVEGTTLDDLPKLIPKEAVKESEQDQAKESVQDQAEKSEQDQATQGCCTGTKVSANKLDIALFRLHTDEVFAVQEKCPHAGGPLHLGDIEMLPDKSLCVRCPWHKWRFDLETGEHCKPYKGRKNVKVYPVKVDQQTKRIYIGFERAEPELLQFENF